VLSSLCQITHTHLWYAHTSLHPASRPTPTSRSHHTALSSSRTHRNAVLLVRIGTTRGHLCFFWSAIRCFKAASTDFGKAPFDLTSRRKKSLACLLACCLTYPHRGNSARSALAGQGAAADGSSHPQMRSDSLAHNASEFKSGSGRFFLFENFHLQTSNYGDSVSESLKNN
jgi:hypothetical protein